MNLRTIATPLTIGSSVLLCVTGLCLLARLRGGLIDPLHEVSGLVFVVGLAFHVVVHRKATIAHLKRPLGLVLVVVFSLLSALGVLSLAHGEDAHDPRIRARRSMELLMEADPADLARLTHRSEAEIGSLLSKGGIARIEPGSSLRELARANGVDPDEALAIVLR